MLFRCGIDAARVRARLRDEEVAHDMGAREKRIRGSVVPSGLLASNVIYLPCTRIKNRPTLLYHYVTKEGDIIGQRGPPVRPSVPPIQDNT